MFINSQNQNEIDSYFKYLKLVGSLSNLFSESKIPYLYYRAAEKVFCKAFLADDLSRSDVSLDAKKTDVGVGLKTFLIGNSKTFQKIAEFNKDRSEYSNKEIITKIIKISEMRNERIAFTERTFNISKSIYHCVVRDENKFKIYEENMQKINISNIQDIEERRGSIIFNDGLHEYSFLKSKSTLTKRFNTNSFLYEINIDILDDPLELIEKFYSEDIKKVDYTVKGTVFLPLYGYDKPNKIKKVFPGSGLNQWNARGRERDVNEVYIPVPKIIHDLIPNFFPKRDRSFNLHLPGKKILQSKICQENNKALMSYSNRELGKWILRDVLNWNEGELMTYEKLEEIGIDSVRVDKIDEENYEMNFSKIGSFENFILKYEDSLTNRQLSHYNFFRIND